MIISDVCEYDGCLVGEFASASGSKSMMKETQGLSGLSGSFHNLFNRGSFSQPNASSWTFILS